MLNFLGLSSAFSKLTLNNTNNNLSDSECDGQIIAFFAHKGGVSKTTNVHHLGYMLAQQFGMKVLLIDADPQTNLTQTLSRDTTNTTNDNIYKALKRIHNNKYTQPANCIELTINQMKTDNNNGKLWLLPGSLDLASLEAGVTFANNPDFTDTQQYELFADIPGSFRYLFNNLCIHYDIDFCLIDMGPSIGELNKSLFWSSDYFIIPCSPDSYCCTTIRTMQQTLPLWCEHQQKMVQITKKSKMPLNSQAPKFLGTIISLYQLNKGKIVQNSLHWMDVIKQTVKVELIPQLKEFSMVAEYPKEISDNGYTLEEIPHFLSLMPIAQRCFAPIFDIPNDGFCKQNEDGEEVKFGKSEISKHKERAQRFEKIYYQLAENIFKMLNHQTQ